MTRLILFILLLVPAFTFAQNRNAQPAKGGAESAQIARDLNVKEFQKQMIAKPGILVDVRTPGEVKKGAIANALNLDIFDDHFEAKLDQLDKSKPVYVYCAVGGRSAEAMEIMKKKGFREVYNLSGGYTAWSKAVK
jgi:phage shock protein E